mgnify:CR=1 FL=1
MSPHPYWINAGIRNVKETTESTPKRFNPGRRRKSWITRNPDTFWVALSILGIITYAVL